MNQLEIFFLNLFQGTSRNTLSSHSRSIENYTRIVQYMEQHICENLSVDEIARGCSMSTVNAKQTFSRYAGIGIRTYFKHLKIERAIALLHSGMSVQETSAALGKL